MKRVCSRVVAFTNTALLLLALAFAYSQDLQFEESPKFKASEILSVDLLKSPYHTVQENVTVIRYGCNFTLETSEGTMDAWSKEMLKKGIRESAAINELNEISQTDPFVTSITEASKSPLMKALIYPGDAFIVAIGPYLIPFEYRREHQI